MRAESTQKTITRRRPRGFLLAIVAICGATMPVTVLAQMTVETSALGMTGWRTKPVAITVETATLGMTGWRTRPVSMTVETPVLGMTGWRTKPLAVTVETAALGMTGWRTGPKPPERTHPFKVLTANLTLFNQNQPLPRRLYADCPVSIGHRAFFTTEGKQPGKIAYHFEWSSGQRSTDYTRLDTGNRADPLYEPPSRFHEFPYPLPERNRGEGDLNRFASNERGANDPAGQIAAPAGPGNEHKGSVRVVVPNPYGKPVISGWARYDIVCKFKPGLVQRPRTTCVGGSVSNGVCLCPSATRQVRVGANAWRCMRPGPTTHPP